MPASAGGDGKYTMHRDFLIRLRLTLDSSLEDENQNDAERLEEMKAVGLHPPETASTFLGTKSPLLDKG